MAEESQERISFPLKWTGVEDLPIQFTNEMLVQHVKNDFILTFGHMTPPPLISPVDPADIEAIKFIPVKPIIRLGMSPQGEQVTSYGYARGNSRRAY